MESDLQIPVLRVDGGATSNDFLMQYQADILGVPVQLAALSETTALGAAYLAGLAVGLWNNTSEIAQKWGASRIYKPSMTVELREKFYAGWKCAVVQAQAGRGH
jgi:glycerol kinase